MVTRPSVVAALGLKPGRIRAGGGGRLVVGGAGPSASAGTWWLVAQFPAPLRGLQWPPEKPEKGKKPKKAKKPPAHTPSSAAMRPVRIAVIKAAWSDSVMSA
ncbi:hypothetical protein SRO_3627 [Streptomyces rochei]|nr:hypothetical protein SRO_3627 [Streptomyces rochei]